MSKFVSVLLFLFTTFAFAGTPDQWRASGIPAANNAVNISPTTNAAGIDVIFGSSAAANKGLVIQAKSAQSANLVELQSSAGATITAFGAASNANFLSMSQGASAAVSGANTGRLIYNATSQAWQISANGGAYADISTAGPATADVYIKAAVRAATKVAGTLATSFENGDTIDTNVVLATGDRILIKDQASPAENGIYTVNASGAPTRATDADTTAELPPGVMVTVTTGTSNAQRRFVSRSGSALPFVLGTSLLYFDNLTMYNTSNLTSVLIGQNAGQTLAAGNSNVFVGAFSGATGTNISQNVGIGYQSLFQAVSDTNTAVGWGSGYGLTTGTLNTAFGAYAGYGIGAASNVTALGYQTAQITASPGGTYVGYQAGNQAGTNAGVVFVGHQAGFVSAGDHNTFVGYSSGDANSSGLRNTFLGYNSGGANTVGGDNTFLGTNAGLVNTGSSANTFIGSGAGAAYNTGVANGSNVAVGSGAAAAITGGIENVFVGQGSGGLVATARSNSTSVGTSTGISNSGNGNTFVGSHSGFSNTSSTGQAFFGFEAGRLATGADNSIFGYQAGDAFTTGTRNSFFGKDSGGAAGATAISDSAFFGYRAGLVATGNDNTFVGSQAGDGVTSGTDNVLIGSDAGGNSGAAAMSSVVAIGSNAALINTANQNTFVGTSSGEGNGVGTGQAFFGAFTGRAATGSNNSIFGYNAGDAFTTGARNSIFGKDAGGATAATGMDDTAMFGYQAGLLNTADSNTFIGSGSGAANTSGIQQTFVGYQSGLAVTGSGNTVIGYNAGGGTLTTGGSNVLIGNNADTSASNTDNAVSIGSGSVAGSNQFVSVNINDVFFGTGVVSSSATAYTINGSGGFGTNNAGAALQLAGGKGTGTAEPGLVVVKYPLKTSTGTTLQSFSTPSFPVVTTMFTGNGANKVVTADGAAGAEVTLLDTVTGSVSLEGGLLRVGRTLRFKISGAFTMNGSPPDLTFRLKHGSTTLLSCAMTTAALGSETRYWEWDGQFVVRSLGGVATATGCSQFSTITSSGVAFLRGDTTIGTFDSTATANLDITIQFGAATAGNSVTGLSVTMEVLN